MVDIHSHVLWGMDDGAPTMDVSLEMLRMAAEAGTTDIVATPHSNAEFEYQPALIAERIEELTRQTGGRPRIHRGCDLHLSFDNIVDAVETPGKYSIILMDVEMPKDREEPRTQVTARTERRAARERALGGVLHQIVGPRGIVR